MSLEGLAVDHVFIGSCTNARIEDLRAVAHIVRGRRVAAGLRAMVVPGSSAALAQAEAEGIAQVLLDAGFEWRQPGCSMCLAMNDDVLAPGQRCASTTNRNFEERLDTSHPGRRRAIAATRILVACANFGCGSTREHAVWGLRQYGIQAVIASAYGEIFYSKAMNNRLLAVLLPEDQVQALRFCCSKPHRLRCADDADLEEDDE